MCKKKYVSTVGFPTKETALRALEDLQLTNNSWIILDAYVEPKLDGWYPVIIHK